MKHVEEIFRRLEHFDLKNEAREMLIFQETHPVSGTYHFEGRYTTTTGEIGKHM